MKHRFIRRMTAMALAMVLAMPLAAPVHAAEGDSEEVLWIESDRTDPLWINETDELTLTAKWADGKEPARKATYSWTYDKDSKFVKIEDGEEKDGQKTFKVTGKATGTEVITLKAEYTDYDGETVTVPATYKLEVTDISLTITGSSSVLWTDTTADKTFTVILGGIVVENPKITWTVSLASPHPGMVVPTFSGTGAEDPVEKNGKVSTTVTGTTVTVGQQTAGEFLISASYTAPDGKVVPSNEVQLTISGVVLSGTRLNAKEKTMDMVVNGSAVLSADLYGDAVGDDITVDWSSDDSAIVSVMPDAGNLNAWMAGETYIYATTSDGKYSARCRVTVDEDKSVIAEKYPNTSNGRLFTASVSEPLVLGDVDGGYRVYTALNEICKVKTAENREYADEVNEIGYGLDYITNLSVPTSQGTLYYNYNTEADTGDGVGYNDQFTSKDRAGGSKLNAEWLCFVPKAGVTGTVDITFTGVALNRRNFSGIIRVSVGSGSGAYQISYRTQAGEPARFASSDFDAYCRSEYGRSYNYIIFNLPKSSEGVLYYNYIANSGNPVTTTTQFTPSGRYTLDDVCFVPNAAFQGTSVTISFRGVDTSGKAISGEVLVTVTQPSTAGDRANVTITGERGKPVTLQSNLFNNACRETLDDTLNFVTFKLPDPDEGTLYINYRGEGSYDGRVTAGTRCYFSGVPGLDSISFVPASSAVSRVAISYTGYGAEGDSFSGVLYIDLDEADRTTIYYSVPKGGAVTFRTADFYNAALYRKGVGVTYVRFGSYSTSRGRLYYSRPNSSTKGSVTTSTQCYYSPTTSQVGLGRVYFSAEDTVGTVRIPYTAYCGTGSSQQTFTGEVVIQVGSITPDDVNLFCTAGDYAQLTSWAVDSVCSAAMNGNLSYIEITSVPDAKEGRLYSGYSAFRTGSGTVVQPGDRFYLTGLSGIDQLRFVPFARFTGEAEITYIGIGYSANGQELQVSGRIVVSVTKSATSVFDDMDGDTWAMDSVDYLYRNGTVKGIGNNCFAPRKIVSKGDFTLMLVRAYGLTATGSVSFSDVPANSYYADAIRIAAVLGIVNGENGKFNPTTPLTRQDAIVMIYKTLQASGKAATNGLAADLSVYHDEGSIDPGAREAMGILVQMGVVEGDGGYLRPQRQLTRAEAAMLLHTIMTL